VYFSAVILLYGVEVTAAYARLRRDMMLGREVTVVPDTERPPSPLNDLPLA
jgi:hypothetical protein